MEKQKPIPIQCAYCKKGTILFSHVALRFMCSTNDCKFNDGMISGLNMEFEK